MMENSIYGRLLRVESDFLSAILAAEPAMENFEKFWSQLQLDVGIAVEEGRLSEGTMAMVHHTASNVAILAESLLDLDVHSEQVTLALRAEVKEVFSQTNHLPATSLTSSQPLIAPAYQWLMENLHNPYPTPETKQSLAQLTGKSVESINRWFMNARSRIGWTEISKKYFYCSRNDTIDGAYRAYFEDDPKNPLPSKVVFSFMKMKSDAEMLYSDKIMPSRLAMQIDAVVKDMTPEERARLHEMKARAIDAEKKRKVVEKEQRRIERSVERERQKASKRAIASYPSPVRSRGGSPEPSDEPVVDDDEHRAASSPAPVSGCKRRLSTSSKLTEATVDRPFKRSRINADQSIPNAFSLPSPESCPDEDVYYGLSTLTGADFATDTPSVVSPSRKRRLSDGESQSVPKRPRGLPVGPRLQAVSDPMPMSSALSEAWESDFSWLSEAFEIPGPATTGTLDTSEDLYVKLFNNWCMPADVPADDSTPGLSPDIGPLSLMSESSLPEHNVDLGGVGRNAFTHADVVTFNNRSGVKCASAMADGSQSPSDLETAVTSFSPVGIHVQHDSSDLPIANGEQLGDFLKLAEPTLSCSEDLQGLSSFFESSDLANHTWSHLPQISSTEEQASVHPITGFHTEQITGFGDNFSALQFPSLPLDIYDLDHEASRRKQEMLEQLRVHEEAARKLKEELAVSAW